MTTEPVPEDPVVRGAETWLNGQGYPLEYRAAGRFREAGLHVTQGFHVRDPVEGVARELDVLASGSRALPKNREMRVSLVVECKWSGKRPWIVLTSDAAPQAPFVSAHDSIASDIVLSWLWLAGNNKAVADNFFFAEPTRSAFSALQGPINQKPEADGSAGAKKEQGDHKDSAFEAMQSVAGKAAALAQRFEVTENGVPEVGIFTFPVIVVRGTLLEARYLADSNRIAVEPVKWSRLQWHGAHSVSHAVTIDIVEESHLQNYAQQARAGVTTLLDLLADIDGQFFEWINQGGPGAARREVQKRPMGLPPPKFLQQFLSESAPCRSR